MLKKRVLTAVAFLPVFFFVTFYKSNLFFFLTITAVVVIGLYEFFCMVEKKKILPLKVLGYVLGVLLVGGIYYSVSREDSSILSQEMWRLVEVAAIVTLLVVGSFIVEMLQKENLTITGVGTTIFGVMYVSWLMGHLILLVSVPYGKVYTFVLFFSTWVGDGAAYIVGRKIGKRKLIPRISPNKTVEGAVAGLATTLLAVVALKAVEFREPLSYYIRINGSQLDFKEILPGFSYLDAIILGFLISVFGQVGDLAESLIKRDAGVKDSGSMFPGHGGVLDVIDSLIFTGPVMYYYWFFIVSGR